MTIKKARTVQLRCSDCGHTTPLTTAGMADYSMRKHSCATVKERAARAQRRLDSLAASGPERPCLHKHARHTHGTYAAYTLDKCRCRPCRDATSAYERNRVREQLYGRWNGYVDAQPARDHVRVLMDGGMGLKRIVAVSGISQGCIWKLMYGKRQADGTLRPSRRVTPAIEAAILATRLDLAGGARTQSVGTARRIQALVARGWSMSKIAARLDIRRANFTPVANGTRDVTAATAKAVADLYDELWNVAPPTGDHRDRIAYARALSHAKRLHWAPPLAWDDDTIDDPTATPAVDLPDGAEVDELAIERALIGDRVPLTEAERLEVLTRLVADGLSDRAIADRMHVSDRTVLRWRQTHHIESRWAA